MILVFGKSGQVARELSKLDQVKCIGRDIFNLEEPENCAKIINRYQPKSVINAAAYTKVDKAEDEYRLANRINSETPTEMARVCKRLAIPFVHISTDYVFDGTGLNPWDTDDFTAPLGNYGRTKRDGELKILNINSNAVILRTSWVFAGNGHNFVKTILSLAENRSEILVTGDQIGGPTSARAVARSCHVIATDLMRKPFGKSPKGLYHFSGVPDVSWAEFAKEILLQARRNVSIKEISTPQAPAPALAMRPLNSRLNCKKIKVDFNITRPRWKEDLKIIINQLLISKS